jgi:hypothetical protein
MGTLEQDIKVKISAIVAGLKEVQKLQTELKGLEKASGKKLSVNTSGAEQGLGKLNKLLSLFSSNSNIAIQKAEGIGKVLGIAVGPATALTGVLFGVTAGLFLLEKKIADSTGKFIDLSQRVNFTVETLSAVDNAAQQTGTSVDELNSGLGIFDKNIARADEGGNAMSDTFKRLNIDTSDNEKALSQVWDILRGMPEDQNQVNLALELFGKNGRNVLAVIKESGGSLEEYKRQLKEAGVLITTEAAQAGDKFGDALKRLEFQVAALAREVNGDLLPTLTNLFEIVTSWIHDNKEDIIGFFSTIGTVINVSIIKPIRIVISLLSALYTNIRTITDGLLEAAGPAVAAAEAMAASAAKIQAATQKAIDNLPHRSVKNPVGLDVLRGAIQEPDVWHRPKWTRGAWAPPPPDTNTGGGGGSGKAGRESQIPGLLQQLKAKGEELAAKIREGVLNAQATGDEQAFNLLKDTLEREKKLIDEQLEDRLTSISDYYEAVALKQEESTTAEIAREQQKTAQAAAEHAEQLRRIDEELKAKRAEIDAKGGKTPPSERDLQKKLAAQDAEIKREESLQQFNEKKAQSEGQINLLLQRRKQLAEDNERVERLAQEALNDQISDFNDLVNEVNGRTSQNVIRAINDRLQPLLEKVIQEQGLDSPLAKLIQQFIDLASDRALIDELIGRAGRLNDRFNVRSAEVQAHTAQNVIAEANARRELNALLQEYASKQLVILRQALAIAEANHDEEKIFDVRSRIADIEQLKNEQQSFNQELKNTAINAAASGLQNLFHDIVTGAKSAKEAMRDFLLSLLDALEQVIIKMIVVKILSIALGMASGGSDGFFGNKDTVLSLDGQFAEGGILSSRPGGRLIQVAEGGFDEVVLTTDPKHRNRTQGLLAAFLERTGIAPAFASGGFVSGESLLNSISARIPRMAAGGFIGDIPVGGNLAGATGGSTSNFNFQFARPEDKGFRLPTRAAFRDAARQLRERRRS